MKGAKERCHASGMDGYVSKPIEQHKLREVLEKFIPGEGETLPQTSNELPSLSPSNSNTIIDWAHIHDFTENDAEMEAQLIQIFVENLHIDLADLKAAFDDMDAEEWDKVAHKLFGAASHIGARRLAEICDSAQSINGNHAQQIAKIHPQIITESEKVLGVLNEKLAA